MAEDDKTNSLSDYANAAASLVTTASDKMMLGTPKYVMAAVETIMPGPESEKSYAQNLDEIQRQQDAFFTTVDKHDKPVEKAVAIEQGDAIGRGLANGMTFGAADYIAGIADTLVKDTTPSADGTPDDLFTNIAQQRALTETAASTYKNTYVGSLLGGGFVTGLAGASKILDKAPSTLIDETKTLLTTGVPKGAVEASDAAFAKMLALTGSKEAAVEASVSHFGSAGNAALAEYVTALGISTLGAVAGVISESVKAGIDDAMGIKYDRSFNEDGTMNTTYSAKPIKGDKIER